MAEINDVASANTTGSANYGVKYDSNNLDAPDEFQAFENEDTVGLSGSGGETEYNHFNFDAPDENEVFVNDIKNNEATGDLWSESPRARARAGMRRRRLANRSVAQKLRAEVYGLFEVMMACTLMAGSLTREIIEDPLWEAWAVLQPKHHVKAREAKTDCLELFAGEARISGAYARRKRAVLQPRDVRYNHDWA